MHGRNSGNAHDEELAQLVDLPTRRVQTLCEQLRWKGLLGTSTRWRKVQQQNIPLNPLVIFQATSRGHLAYTYQLCRHLTRYYTLSLLATGLLVPPFLPLVLILCSIVMSVGYIRLQPDIGLPEYALCSLLDDCAYEVGIVLGCIKYRARKPLLPIIHIKRKNR